MPPISLLSYNLKFHAAYPELPGLVRKHAVDVLCLQECFANKLPSSLAGLKLATKTSSGKLGLAIYYNKTRFSVDKSASVPLCLSVYERLHVEDRERLLFVELYDRVHKASLLVASFHATHLIASNALRRQQLSLALDTLNNMYDKRPTVLVGDFNYPLFHGGLKRATKRLGYDLHIPDNPTYSGRHVMGRFDMAVTVRVSAHMQVLPFGLSDHAPILLRVEE